jgi:hypothetical protein
MRGAWVAGIANRLCKATAYGFDFQRRTEFWRTTALRRRITIIESASEQGRAALIVSAEVAQESSNVAPTISPLARAVARPRRRRDK